MLKTPEIIRWFDKHTLPDPAIVGDAKRQRAQLYALLSLIGMITAIFSFALLLLFNPEPFMINATLIGTPSVILIYLLSRTRFVEIAVVTTMVVNYLWVSVTISLSLHPDYAVFVFVMPMVFVSLLFSARITILATLASILLGLVMGTTGGRPVTFELVFSLLLILICGIGIVTTNIIRERDQRKLAVRTDALARSEERYRALFQSSAVPLSEEDFSIVNTTTAALKAQGIEDVPAYLRTHPETVEIIFRALEPIEVNEATLELYGAKDKSQFDQYFAEVFFSLNQQQIAESAIALWRGDLEFSYEAIDYTIQGERFDCRIQWVRLSDQPPRIVVSLEDLTPIKDAERQRKELEVERARSDMLQRFLGDTTHDLLTPLTIVNTSVYLGLRAQTVEQTHERLRTIKAQAEHLEMMIKDMLTMSRLDAPAEDAFSFQTGDVSHMLSKTVAEFEPLAQGKQQQIIYTPASVPHRVRYDSHTLGRAVRNLIQNAIKYTPQQGSINVCSDVNASHLTIKVSDSGVGIPEADLPHIFDRFYRVESHRPLDGGSGLGLAIVKKVIDAHQGEITVVSAPSSGTTFTIRLPLVD
jgi:signal transduction histidine kinase